MQVKMKTIANFMETVKLCPGVGQKGEAVLMNVTEKATLQYARIIRNFLYLT